MVTLSGLVCNGMGLAYDFFRFLKRPLPVCTAQIFGICKCCFYLFQARPRSRVFFRQKDFPVYELGIYSITQQKTPGENMENLLNG